MEHTKRSSVAVPKVGFLGDSRIEADMSMSIRSLRAACLLNSASNVVRKGLRDDMGLLAELARFWSLGEGRGELVLLRKGLLEGRLRLRPGDGRRSVDKER